MSVTRTRFLPRPMAAAGLSTAPPARALIDFATRHADRRDVSAVLCDAAQRGVVTVAELEVAAARCRRSGRAGAHVVVEALRDGVRSAPEADFREIARASRVPKPWFNALLRLPDGRCISPDALVPDAALVHETNGRLAHADDDQFASMQERHDVMTAAGLTVLHNPPARLLRHPTLVRREWEQCYARTAGSGLPRGIRVLRLGPDQ